jgi:hypothetical protein
MVVWFLGGALVLLGFILLPMWREIVELLDRVSPIPDRAARRRAISARLIERTITALIALGGGALAIGLAKGFADLLVGTISWWSGASMLLLLIIGGQALRDRYRRHIWLLNQPPEVQQHLMALPWVLRQEIIFTRSGAGIRQSARPTDQPSPDTETKEHMP